MSDDPIFNIYHCDWQEEDGNGPWMTTCGNSFEFTDGGPEANGFKFCPYCGKKAVEIRGYRPR